MFTAVFNILQLLVSGHALRFGGAPERIVGALLLLAAGATAIKPVTPTSYLTIYHALLAIDAALFVALLGIAAFADRYWPMWLASLQLVSIGAHLAKGLNPELWMRAYWLLTANIAWPMLFVLLGGTMRHRRRLAAGMPERAWSEWRHER